MATSVPFNAPVASPADVVPSHVQSATMGRWSRAVTSGRISVSAKRAASQGEDRRAGRNASPARMFKGEASPGNLP
jgi:hypothetical protein